jgi:hypothetical protein
MTSHPGERRAAPVILMRQARQSFDNVSHSMMSVVRRGGHSHGYCRHFDETAVLTYDDCEQYSAGRARRLMSMSRGPAVMFNVSIIN